MSAGVGEARPIKTGETARNEKSMKTVEIYTDGKAGFAALFDVPTRSPLARQPLGDDEQAPPDGKGSGSERPEEMKCQ